MRHFTFALSLVAFLLSLWMLAIHPGVEPYVKKIHDTLKYFSWQQMIPHPNFTDLPVVELTVSEKKLERLEADRQKYRMMRPMPKLNVRGKLRMGGQIIPVKITYRGDSAHHWTAGRKSLRLEGVGNRLINGMNEVSLIVPEARNWFNGAFGNYLAGA